MAFDPTQQLLRAALEANTKLRELNRTLTRDLDEAQQSLEAKQHEISSLQRQLHTAERQIDHFQNRSHD